MYLERFKLTDRVALVTGGASGIGFSTAQALAEAGARVTIADLQQDVISEAKAKFHEMGYSADGVVMDVTDSDRVTGVADSMVRDLGRIDILVNSAGIARSQTPSEHVVSGLIVNRPQAQSYYNSSKAAVHHLTKSLAAEWASRGVRVNAVAPTYIATPINAFADKTSEMYCRWIDGTPMARLGEPEEVASVILFLASDAASLMTGSIVLVDGGYSCW